MKARAVVWLPACSFPQRIIFLLAALFLLLSAAPGYSQIVVYRTGHHYVPVFRGAVSNIYLPAPVQYGYSSRVYDDYRYDGAVYDEGTYLYDYVNRPYPFTPGKIWRKMFSSIDDRMDAETRAFGVPGQAYRERLYHAYAARKARLNLDLD